MSFYFSKERRAAATPFLSQDGGGGGGEGTKNRVIITVGKIIFYHADVALITFFCPRLHNVYDFAINLRTSES